MMSFRHHNLTPSPLGVVLVALTVASVAACSGPTTYLLGEPHGELEPSRTVASNDGFTLEEAGDNSRGGDAASGDERHGLRLILPGTSAEPAARLVVNTLALHTTRLKLTPLTLGEAVLYERGEIVAATGAQYEFTAEDDARESTLDLSQLASHSSLLALDARVLDDRGDVIEEHRQLLQLNPFHADATLDDSNTLSLSLRERLADTPVTGAEITLLDGDGRRLARSLTNTKGDALLRPRDSNHAPRFVSIRTPRHLALIPYPTR